MDFDAVGGETRSRSGGLWKAWRDPRTFVLGLFVLGFAFTEGTANEWLAYVLVNDLKVSEGIGAFAFAVFVAAMTIGRVAGGGLVSRIGRVKILRLSAIIALCGVLTVALSDVIAFSFVGAVLWGLGAALGFPVGMTAAADDPLRAAVNVSVVSTIGYAAFLGGPPLLGMLGGHFGIQKAILVVCAGLALSYVAASATRRLPATYGKANSEQ